MTRTFVYSISAEESGTKITDYLRNHGYSRHILTCLKHTDDTVLVNGLGVYMNYVLQPDDRLTIVIPEETPSEHIVPVNLPFPVVYEDEDLMIITDTGVMIRTSVGNISQTGRSTQGVKVMRLDQDAKIVTFTTVQPEEKDEEVVEENE